MEGFGKLRDDGVREMGTHVRGPKRRHTEIGEPRHQGDGCVMGVGGGTWHKAAIMREAVFQDQDVFETFD